MRRILSSIVLCAVVFAYATAVEGASIGAGGPTFNGDASQPAICHTGRSDGLLLQSTGTRKGSGLPLVGLLGLLGLLGATGSPPPFGWTSSEMVWPRHVLHGRLGCANRNARGPPRHDL